MKTGGWGGSGERAKAEGEEVLQKPTASSGDANLTLSFPCHLLISSTQGDSAGFLLPPAFHTRHVKDGFKKKKRKKIKAHVFKS